MCKYQCSENDSSFLELRNEDCIVEHIAWELGMQKYFKYPEKPLNIYDMALACMLPYLIYKIKKKMKKQKTHLCQKKKTITQYCDSLSLTKKI